MSLTVAGLLGHTALGLRRLTGDPNSLDHGVEWVSSSDLADPTPFLTDNQVLLTTGSQFLGLPSPDHGINGLRTGPGGETDYDSYISRLVRVGVTALGYGTEVVRPGTPAGLVQACATHGLPLFEVPYKTAFIAIIRHVTDTLAAAANERQVWAMNAQRAVSFAALRPNPLRAILFELARLLGRPVVLFGTPGPSISRFGSERPIPDLVTEEAARLLARGQRSATTLDAEGVEVSLQTVGRRDDLRAVLALFGPALDPAQQGVVTNVIALAGLALEQGRGLRRARRALRAGVLEVLLDGRPALARVILQHIHEVLPPEPLRVALWQPAHGSDDPLLRELDERTQAHPGWGFFAGRGREIFAIFPAAETLDSIAGLASARDLHAGVSDPSGYSSLAEGMDQARRALAADPHGGGAPSLFSELGGRTLAGLLIGAEAEDRSREILAPLRTHDRIHGTELIASLSTWLEHNGHWEPAARALGIHRHTLRARVAQIESITGENLGTMASRTNYWLALHTR